MKSLNYIFCTQILVEFDLLISSYCFTCHILDEITAEQSQGVALGEIRYTGEC